MAISNSGPSMGADQCLEGQGNCCLPGAEEPTSTPGVPAHQQETGRENHTTVKRLRQTGSQDESSATGKRDVNLHRRGWEEEEK